MSCSTAENSPFGAEPRWHTPVIIATTLIAVASFALSLWNFYDAQLRYEVNVIAGRQVRLFVAFEDEARKEPRPCIMMSMVYSNSGGKVGRVFDTKLNVKWFCGERIALEREFHALRELDNFLTVEGACTQFPVSPVVLLGKSSEVRRYAFTPYEPIRQVDIPENFDLEIEIYTQSANLWLLRTRYRVDNVTDVWQDLESGTTFNATVLDIREIS